MQLSLNTAEEISGLDKQILAVLVGGEIAAAPAAKASTAPAKTAASKPASKEEKVVEPEPEPDEDLVGDSGPTAQDVMDAASKLVSTGKSAVVKSALEELSTAKVRDLEPSDYQAFLNLIAAA